MGTEVAKANLFGGKVSLRNADAIAAAMQNAAQDGALGMAPEGSQYLNFSGKRGVYEFGQEKEDLDDEELWVLNVESFQTGWVCWKGGNKLAARLASIFAEAQVPMPDFAEHGPFKEGEGWQKAKAMVVRSLDRDAQGYFTTNSKSGVAVIADVQQTIFDRMTANQPFWPVIQFGKEKFQAKGNWNYKPVITVYGWLSTAALNMLAEDPEADIDELIDASEQGKAVAASSEATEEQEVDDYEPEVPEEVEAEVKKMDRAATANRRRAKIEAAKVPETPPVKRRARL